MKILLIHPPWAEIYDKYGPAAKVGLAYPSLGLCYIASALEQKGHTVRIIDAEIEGADIPACVREAKRFLPDLIGVTSTTPLFHIAKNLVKSLKSGGLDAAVIMGGPHITVMGEQVLRECPEIDFGVYGEGEETIGEFIEAFGGNKDYGQIKGLIYRRDEGIIRNSPRPFIEDLDKIPFPNRKLLRLDRYLWSVPKKGVVKFTTFFTERGCPFQCIFCSQRTIFGTKVRCRNIENVLNELEDIRFNLGISHIQFCDETLTLNRGRLLQLCEGIRNRKIDITWEGFTRANLVDEEMLREMKRAGFVRVSFGIESGNPDILKKIKKGVTLPELRRAFQIAKKVGLETRGSVMIGHPFETKETVMDSLNFIRNLKGCDQIYLNITTPYPGTELYEMTKNNIGGIKLLTNDFSSYKRYGNAVIEVNDLKREDLISLQKKGFRMFYFTPRRIFYNLKRAGFKAGAMNAWAFLKSIR